MFSSLSTETAVVTLCHAGLGLSSADTRLVGCGGGFDGGVFQGVVYGVFGDYAVTGVVGDVVVKELGGVGVNLLGVFVGDFGGHLEQGLVELGVEIGAGDIDAFADVGCGDALGELVGGLIVVFGDLTVTFFVVGDGLSKFCGEPDVNLELKGHDDAGDGERGVRGVDSVGPADDVGAGEEIGIADCGFVGAERRHGWRRRASIEGVARVDGGRLVIWMASFATCGVDGDSGDVWQPLARAIAAANRQMRTGRYTGGSP
jgi:hypothetical protein